MKSSGSSSSTAIAGQEIVEDPSPQLLRELADLIVRATPVALVERLAFKETLTQARNHVRKSNLPPMAKLSFYEQTFIAEEHGDLRADHKTAEVAKATGMSERSVRRHQRYLVDANFVRPICDGRGAGGRKGVELVAPGKTIIELSELLHGCSEE